MADQTHLSSSRKRRGLSGVQQGARQDLLVEKGLTWVLPNTGLRARKRMQVVYWGGGSTEEPRHVERVTRAGSWGSGLLRTSRDAAWTHPHILPLPALAPPSAPTSLSAGQRCSPSEHASSHGSEPCSFTLVTLSVSRCKTSQPLLFPNITKKPAMNPGHPNATKWF